MCFVYLWFHLDISKDLTGREQASASRQQAQQCANDYHQALATGFAMKIATPSQPPKNMEPKPKIQHVANAERIQAETNAENIGGPHDVGRRGLWSPLTTWWRMPPAAATMW